jgi:biotin carboxylase
MNFVALSPHFPPNYHLFCVHLDRLGIRVLGIADERYELLQPELRSALTEYYRVEDLHDYKALRQACQHFIDRFGKLDRIESHNEYWLETQARLRAEFDIPGLGPDAIADVKRKSRMKQIFQRAGILVARGRVARTLEEARELIEETGFPVVAKPDVGVGAAATYKLHDARQLEEFFARKPPVDYILEEFVRGTITTFDGLVDRQGKVVFCTSLLYSQGVMETVNEDRHISFYSVREIPADLEALGRRTLEAFGARETFFHFEYFRLPDGSLMALEVNMRPPGSPCLDMSNYACEIDLYREYAKVVAFGTTDLQYSRKHFCCFIGRKLKYSYVHSHEQVLAFCGSRIAHHQPIQPIFRTAMGDYTYIVRSPDLEEIRQMVEFIQRT